MTTWLSLYHLVRADFLERTRRYSFLIVLGLTVWAGYAFVPPNGANYAAMSLGDYRGVYNSAWIGTMVAIMTSVFLTLTGFYLVKNAIERDERTGVGQIIATTPLSKLMYIFGKALSNFAVLAAIAAVLAVVALAMQYLRAEDAQLDLWALWSPFVFILLPALATVAATAVLFETIRWLRGGFGNIVYFFVWVTVLVAGSILPSQGKAGPAPINDLFGISIPLAHMTAAAKAAYPTYDGTVTIGFSATEAGTLDLQTFLWEGMDWTPVQVAGRLLWTGAAMALILLAVLFFNRFDVHSGWVQHSVLNVRDAPLEKHRDAATLPPSQSAMSLTSLPPALMQFNLLAILHAELRLLLKGQPWWWYAGALGLIVAGVVASPDAARQIALPLAWVWPILIWSGLGSREARHATGALMFSTAHPLARQLPATLLAGMVAAGVAGSGVVFTLVRTSDVAGILSWSIGMLFIPALALALGTWSGSSKLFEVIYVMWWYGGPLNGVAGLDFMGAQQTDLWPNYLALAIVLLIVAAIGRWRQVQHAT